MTDPDSEAVRGGEPVWSCSKGTRARAGEARIGREETDIEAVRDTEDTESGQKDQENRDRERRQERQKRRGKEAKRREKDPQNGGDGDREQETETRGETETERGERGGKGQEMGVEDSTTDWTGVGVAGHGAEGPHPLILAPA